MRSRGIRATLVLVAVLGLIAAACSDNGGGGGDGDGDGGGEGSIWVLLPDTESSTRWEEDDRRFFGQFFSDEGLADGEDFTIVNAEGDAATQQSQAEQAIADGASVIVLTRLDTGSGAALSGQAAHGGGDGGDVARFHAGG